MNESASPSGPKFTDWSREFLHGLIARTTRADGQPPFSDQSLVDLATGTRQLVVLAAREKPAAAAIVLFSNDSFEAEFVVDPIERHQGLGNRMMIELLRKAPGSVHIWAHGDHPDARALARRYKLEAVRELLQLRAQVPATEDTESGDAENSMPSGAATRIDHFRVGDDDAEWVEVNSRAFAAHPEQGRLTQTDLDARIAESWFAEQDFLIARDPNGAMMGFCWLKVIPDESNTRLGEFYAVGVHPSYQGLGLGRELVKAGIDRLGQRGISTASLYVEADNIAAVTLYRSFGFTDHSVDIQYEMKR